ncbi:hypothetical protein Agub_g6447 [Astrephomene gubernaculifera]|uniref:Uncharacterized protein n=1 Tax=Astrephomene gubernaculifera TaxID=47775 RepID=A0AAD3DNV3_9CHLO|nr:hypothetical protein Agub_g6447 [Astrephomene gubernaculifera]
MASSSTIAVALLVGLLALHVPLAQSKKSPPPPVDMAPPPSDDFPPPGDYPPDQLPPSSVAPCEDPNCGQSPEMPVLPESSPLSPPPFPNVILPRLAPPPPAPAYGPSYGLYPPQSYSPPPYGGPYGGSGSYGGDASAQSDASESASPSVSSRRMLLR